MQSPTSLISKGLQTLKPGGLAIVMTPSWIHNSWGPFYVDHTHVTPFTATSLTNAMKMCGYVEVETQHFYQLPFLWRMPFLLPLVKLFGHLPLPYKPFHQWSPPWPGGFNKLIRFSKEVMLLAVGRKPAAEEVRKECRKN